MAQVAKKIGPPCPSCREKKLPAGCAACDALARDFVFTMLPARKAVRVEVAIARVIGEPLFRAFMEVQKTGMSEDQQLAAASQAVGLLASNMNPDDLEQTQLTVFNAVTCNGIPIDSGDKVDSIFSGRPRELWEVFVEALKVNFSDFLPAVGSPLLAGLKSTLSPSSPPTSTGTSGKSSEQSPH